MSQNIRFIRNVPIIIVENKELISVTSRTSQYFISFVLPFRIACIIAALIEVSSYFTYILLGSWKGFVGGPAGGGGGPPKPPNPTGGGPPNPTGGGPPNPTGGGPPKPPKPPNTGGC